MNALALFLGWAVLLTLAAVAAVLVFFVVVTAVLVLACWLWGSKPTKRSAP